MHTYRIESGAVLGYNRAMLLRKVMGYDSVEKAAKSISIPSDHAHELIAAMNKSARLPLVEIAVEEITSEPWIQFYGPYLDRG